MEIRIYNSLTNKKEVFKPIKNNEVSIYVCGPTVYNDPHIGNMRPPVFFDTLNRFFTILGYKVKYVSNFTDVDDKIINKALEEGVSEKVISERYIERYKECLNKLNILPAYKNPRATEYMNQMIQYINDLIEKGFAYVNDGEVFFDVEKDKTYGCLSNANVNELEVGARIEANNKKKSPLDFLLWKKTEKGIKWNTPWCEGRPGWHTECCVMIHSIFGEKIDIHGGGVDLKFPHHENEIAQSMCHDDSSLANYWIHNAMMNINGNKMSKSLGNVILAKDAIEEFGADTLRLFLLNAPYRSIINLNNETLKDTKSILEKLNNCYKQLNLILNENNEVLKGKSIKIETFLEILSDDFNVSNAVTYTLNLIKEANLEIRKKEVDIESIKDYFYALNDIIYVLGLNINAKEFSEEELNLLKEYKKAKEEKDYSKSDELRKILLEKNIL